MASITSQQENQISLKKKYLVSKDYFNLALLTTIKKLSLLDLQRPI